ncbi:hypothetical protein XENOCAPTIV_024590, partial [Xenoophorus captivus]
KEVQSEPDYDRVLLRVMHLFEEEEDSKLSKPVTVNLKDVLKGLGEVRDVEERSLTGTWNITSLQRWNWKTADTSGKKNKQYLKSEDKDFTVTISPKEIRTFFVHFSSRNC